MNSLARKVHQAWNLRVLRRMGLLAFDRHTNNVSSVRWLGRSIRQNPLDIWTIQEIITDREVDFVIETGTLDGGSAFFVATLFDLLGRGHVVSIDIETGEHRPPHPRIDYLHGSSTSPEISARVRSLISEHDATEVLVVLDSDHHAPHVLNELRTYSDLTAVGGYIVVQDGIVDELPDFKGDRPGPLPAINEFLRENPDFEVDEERSSKFLFHYSPRGCLRRVR